jgi:hypothetical protein
MVLVDVKQAVDAATEYFSKLMTVRDIRLEEIEISDDDRFWCITLSGLVPSQKPLFSVENEGQPALSALGDLFRPDFERVYRVFTFDAANGSIRSMKIRQL